MAINVLSKVVIVARGEYNSSTTYNPLDLITHNGSSYICLDTCTGVTPGTNTNKWMIVSSSENYTLSLNGNVLTLYGSNGNNSSVTFTTADDRLW